MRINLSFPPETFGHQWWLWDTVILLLLCIYRGSEKDNAAYGLHLITGMATFHTPLVPLPSRSSPPWTCPGSTLNCILLTCDRSRILHLTPHPSIASPLQFPHHCFSLHKMRFHYYIFNKNTINHVRLV